MSTLPAKSSLLRAVTRCHSKTAHQFFIALCFSTLLVEHSNCATESAGSFLLYQLA